ncbi:MAG: hypothetical protein IJ724_13730 [Muribaculaceae bacterium]|nr:hypothetical protein [Muribaculaceae bacterium]MBR1727675.1 hypothetical protein [Muribaculaceae bacterium]
MNDISDLLRELLDRYSNTGELDREFRRMLRDDPNLRDEYEVWCDDHGYKTSTGFRDFIDEIVESQDSFWDTYHEFGNNI